MSSGMATQTRRLKVRWSLLRAILVSALLTVMVGCSAPASAPVPGASPTIDPAAGPEQQQAMKDWQQVLAAAKSEGELQLAVVTGTSDELVAAFQLFEKKYGIRTTPTYPTTAEFFARAQAERAAGKTMSDVVIGGSTVLRQIDAEKMTQPPGLLPTSFEPAVVFATDPFADPRPGVGNSVGYRIANYFLLVNNALCPPENCPTSYKDLADPKWKGKILLTDPSGASPGTRFVAYTYLAYGEDYVRGVMANVAALVPTNALAEGQRQIAAGEHPILVHQAGPPTAIWQLPKPHPFRLIVPSDGQMIVTSNVGMLAGAPHPNASRVFMDFLLTREAQQTMASYPGAGFIRTDVTPADPDAVFKPGVKLFQGNPDTVEFAATYTQYNAVADKYLKEFGKR